jgi:hypothetical protein
MHGETAEAAVSPTPEVLLGGPDIKSMRRCRRSLILWAALAAEALVHHLNDILTD